MLCSTVKKKQNKTAIVHIKNLTCLYIFIGNKHAHALFHGYFMLHKLTYNGQERRKKNQYFKLHNYICQRNLGIHNIGTD